MLVETPALPDPLVERILDRLGLPGRPPLDLGGLATLYGAWSQAVPFDNLRKLVHLHEKAAGPLPGDDAVDFFEAWLRWGSGGTCWAGNGALAVLLRTLGFRAERGVATMLVAPDLPPNHGTVVVRLGERRFLVDASILFSEPLLLDENAPTGIEHPARGVRCEFREGRWFVRWKALHAVDGFECRIEALTASPAEFRERHENTRDWSPFNYQVNVRVNRGDTVLGVAFGQRVDIAADGSVTSTSLDHEGRQKLLAGELGFDAALVGRVPPDRPTPPPPTSRTASGS